MSPCAAVPPTVAHLVFPYLFRTGSWVYGQLVHARRFRPIVLTTKTENLDTFPFSPVFSYERVTTVRKALLSLSRGRLRHAMLPYLESVLRSQRARILHSHFGDLGAEMLDLKRTVDLPMVTAFYGADVSQVPRDPGWRARYQNLFDEGNLFLAEGSALRSALVALGCPHAKIVIQRLGVDLENLPFIIRRPDESGTVRVLIAATFREKKGIPDALRAVERVRDRGHRLSVTLIGDAAGKPGDEEEKAEILKLVKPLREVVNWRGFLPYASFREALLRHHVFLSPSLTARDGDSEGGAPVGLIEAEATGMPIVSTLHADIPEVVVDGKSALLSPERDVEALAANLERVVGEPEQWEAMGRAGRAHVEANHDVRAQVARLEHIYDQVIAHAS